MEKRRAFEGGKERDRGRKKEREQACERQKVKRQ